MNNRLEEFKDDITAKKTEIQTLEDASTDMMMLEDDDEKIPYQIGEVFVSMTQVNTKEVCNRGVACSLLKLGSLEKTVIASLFHSGLHSGTIFLWKKRCHMSF